jgi:Tfp pilus assembly protein FimT
MRRGTTIFELAVTLALLGIAAGVALPRFAGYRDRVAVSAAAASALALLSVARHGAIRRAAVTAVRFDSAATRVIVFADRDTLADRPLGIVHGVRLNATRDSIAYAPNGLGYGAANVRLILTRGAAAETITVSRLGRVRR